jgi:hypothetical protein
MYPVRKTRKMPVVKGQKWPAIFLTPQNYSENTRSAARTDILGDTPPQIAFSPSLLWDFNSLFPNNFSLIPDFKFPDNFEAQRVQTIGIGSNYRGIHVYG